MEYRDCIVFVTGGNSGIGRAFVERFVHEGAKVIACGRDEVRLQALKADHPSAAVRHCDITSRLEVEALEAFIAQEYGRLDVLVNNAGVMGQVDLLAGNVEDAAVAREIETNIAAPILLTRRLLPLLKSSRRLVQGLRARRTYDKRSISSLVGSTMGSGRLDIQLEAIASSRSRSRDDKVYWRLGVTW